MTTGTLQLATARIDYIGQVGQRVLNTTVKSGRGLGAVFAPTWEIVMQSKRGEIGWQTYSEHYTELMRQRYRQYPEAFHEAVQSDALVLCCYCRDTHTTSRHCHRYLLVDILQKVAAHHGIAAHYMGELNNWSART